MALPGTRAFNLFEDDPSFNLGMDASAFRNLGMGELAAIQDLGLMSLPGANTTVANENVANALSQADPTQLAKELFDTYVTGFNPNQEALNFWGNKISTMGQDAALNEFLRPADPNAPRLAMMRQDPDFMRATAPRQVIDQDWEGDRNRFTPDEVLTPYVEQARATPIIPTQDMAPEPIEIIDREYLGPSANIARQEVEAAQPVVEAGPKFEGKPYDPAAYDKIVRQLTAQQQALLTEKKFPYTSTFGGPTETIADLAKRLAAMGISDIREFGMKHELPVEKVYETIYQDEGPALTLDTGKYKTISGLKGYDAERNPIFDYRELTPEEVEKLRFDKSGFAFLPSGQIKREDLGNTPYATTKYYNTRTGEEIDTSKFGGKAESGLFASSGAGEGYTNYRVVYDEKGIPVFLPEKEMSGMKEFVAKDLPGILSVLRFIPGASIPVMLAQAGAAAYMGAKPEDILKKIGTTLIASNLDKIAGSVMKNFDITPPTSDFGKLAMQGGLGTLSSLIQGADLEDALKSGALTAASSGISSLLPKSEGGIDYAKVARALAPSIARGQLSNADLFRAISALAPSKKKAPGGP